MSKRALLAVLSIFLVYNLFTFVSASGSNERYVKVGIAYGDLSVFSCEVKSGAGLRLVSAGSGGFSEVLNLPECNELTITVLSSTIGAKDNSGQTVYDGFDPDICIMSYDGGVIRYNGKPYRGGLIFKKNASGKMNVINYIELEDYLCGVLPSEMGYKNPAEALKAQAVTARSYTLRYSEKHKSDGFDLCKDVHCQIYAGYEGEFKETNSAVFDTAGVVLKYGGETVSGYYFKNSGGHTQKASDVWNNDMPYIKGVKDIYSPDYTWSYEMKFAEAEAILSAAGHNIGRIKSVSVTKRNETGAVNLLEIKGTAGTAVLKGDNIRTVLGGTNIKSLFFSFDREIKVQPGDDELIYVIGAGGRVESLPKKDVYVYPGRLLYEALGPSGTVNKTETVTDEPLIFYGKGYGHGVGMPQDSAIEMAKQGYTFTEILKYFYYGIEVE